MSVNNRTRTSRTAYHLSDDQTDLFVVDMTKPSNVCTEETFLLSKNVCGALGLKLGSASNTSIIRFWSYSAALLLTLLIYSLSALKSPEHDVSSFVRHNDVFICIIGLVASMLLCWYVLSNPLTNDFNESLMSFLISISLTNCSNNMFVRIVLIYLYSLIELLYQSSRLY
jgi:hypothetical protein